MRSFSVERLHQTLAVVMHPPPQRELHKERTVSPSVTREEQLIMRKLKPQSNLNTPCDAEGDSLSSMTHVSSGVAHPLAASLWSSSKGEGSAMGSPIDPRSQVQG